MTTEEFGEPILDVWALLISIIEFMAFDIPIEDMPPAERTLLQQILDNT